MHNFDLGLVLTKLKKSLCLAAIEIRGFDKRDMFSPTLNREGQLHSLE
jgi:hypothetical protein